MLSLKWRLRFMQLAETVATWSKDPACQVGAVVVSPDMRRQSVGYNGFPARVPDQLELLENPVTKNQLMVHAEINALGNARTNLTGWYMFVTKAPCLSCAKAIASHGISSVDMPKLDPNSKWYKEQLSAASFLSQAGVRINEHSN